LTITSDNAAITASVGNYFNYSVGPWHPTAVMTSHATASSQQSLTITSNDAVINADKSFNSQ
jgi:hypothetical protein